MIVLCQGSSNGFVHRVFEVGADDILMLPQPSKAVSFTIQKAIARRGGARARGSEPGRLIVVLGPKGGTGKTLTVDQPRRRDAGRGRAGRDRRPRPPVR